MLLHHIIKWNLKYKWLPTYNGLTMIFPLHDGVRAISSQYKQNFEFWILIIFQASNLQYDFCDAGRQQEVTAPSQHAITRVNNWYSTVYCVVSIFLVSCFMFLNPIMSTKHPSASPVSGEKRKAVTLEMKLR